MHTSQPASPSQKIKDRIPLIVLGYLFFIVYGSLIPFELRDYSFPAAIDSFKNIRYLQLGVASRADWVANILLYMPLAFMLMAYSGRGRHARFGCGFNMLLVAGVCVAIAVIVEFTQIFFAPRTVSLNDLIAEIIGSALGICVWQLWSQKLQHWSFNINLGGRRGLDSAFAGYLVLLFAFSLFPFDLLVSLDEFSIKLQGALVALFWVDPAEGLALRVYASRAGLLMFFIPFGALLSASWNLSGQGLKRAMIAGALLASLIEFLQLFIASAVTEGGSVMLAAMGAGLGYGGAQWLKLKGGGPLLKWFSRLWVPLTLGYGVLLMLVSGWFSHAWIGVTEAMSSFNYRALIPFYYHYFSTETGAVRSLVFNAAMYAPPGIGALLLGLNSPHKWSWYRHLALVAGGLLAVVMETGKLFVPLKHPDYTNVLIAMASVWMAFGLGVWLWKQFSITHSGALEAAPVTLQTEPLPMLPPPLMDESAPGRPVQVAAAGLILAALFGLMVMYPVGGIWLFAGVVGYMILLRKYPHSWLIILPLLWPLLDFSAKTGWFFVTEFDCFVLATVAMMLLRKPAPPKVALSRNIQRLITLYGMAMLISLMVGIWPLPPLDANAFNNYLSHYNALRVAKGFILAWLLLPALQAAYADPDRVKRHVVTGLLLGFLVTAGLMLWERAIFPGLLDFSQTYRATAFFSALHVGGGMIDGYLALTIPFIMAAHVLMVRRWAYPIGLLLLMLACYMLVVTYSRISLLTLAFMGISALLLFVRQAKSAKTFFRIIIPAMLMVALVAVTVHQAPFFKSRVHSTQKDLQTRWDHWQNAIDIRPQGLISQLFGAGPGAFPGAYYAAHQVPMSLPGHEYRTEDENPYMHISVGRAFYVIQQIQPQAGRVYDLSIALRPQTANEMLTVSVCEQALLYAYRCVSQIIHPDKVQQWGNYQTTIRYFDHQNWFQAQRPVFVALYLPSGSGVDLDDISLTDESGISLVKNGDFSSFFARWYFTSDDLLRWHIENLPLQIWFEQGWVGLALFLILTGTILFGLVARAWRHDLLAAVYAVSIGSFLLVGLTSSLFDFPKLMFIFYLVFFCGCLHRQQRVPITLSDQKGFP